MRIVQPSFEIIDAPEYEVMLRKIDKAARVCYKSATKYLSNREINPGLIKRCVELKHMSTIEHASITVKIICDRGISHELVRHRLASFSQESTRYANYRDEDKFGGEISVIRPEEIMDPKGSEIWEKAMEYCELAYLRLIDLSYRPQIARSVLPNALKTELYVTANLREWRHIFKLRCAKGAHPQMRRLMQSILTAFIMDYPVFFEDLDDLLK